jgi:hypothetical protein
MQYLDKNKRETKMKFIKTAFALLTVAIALSVNGYSQSFLTNGLVAYYPFNGNANDASGNGNNGTVIGALLTTDRFGAPSAAYAFDGVSSLITVPDSPSLRIANDITVTCWLKFTQTNLDVRFVGKGGDCGRNYGLWGIWGSGTFWMFQQFPPEGGCVGCQENTASTVPPIQIGRWYQMVGVRTGGFSRLYVDGILLEDADGEPENCSATTYTGSEPLLIGAPGYIGAPGNQPNLMQGSIDDIRIYNRALSSSEVVQLYVLEGGFCSPHRAQAIATLSSDGVTGATMVDNGCGYTNSPSIRIVGGGGSGATAIASMTNGIVTDVVITSVGSNYTSTPRILIESPPFVPTVSIAVSKVKVMQQVRVNHNYVLESSTNLTDWTATGPQFTADSETIVNEFDVDSVGRFFRLREVP